MFFFVFFLSKGHSQIAFLALPKQILLLKKKSAELETHQLLVLLSLSMKSIFPTQT